MFTLKEIYFKNRNKLILENINFKIIPGEILGIIGPTGSGKTSLLNIISGRINNFEGEIFFYKSNITKTNRNNIVNTIPFSYEINENDCLEYVIEYIKTPSIKNPDISEKYITLLELNSYLKSKIKNLPDSIFKKLLLLCGFTGSGQITVMDNPETSLDQRSKLNLEKTINHYVFDGNKSVVITSHDLNFLFKTCDRIIQLKDGALIKISEPEKISEKDLEFIFNVKLLLNRSVVTGKPEVSLL